VPSFILPSPLSVIQRFETQKDTLLNDVAITIARVSVGYLIGCALGIVAALCISSSRSLNYLFDRVLPMLRAIPPLAIVPFITLWFGLKLRGMIFLVAWGCFFIMAIDSLEAIKNIPKIYTWASYSLGLNKFGIYRRVIFPAIIPGIIGGLRVSAITGFNLALLAEFNMSSDGIGLIIITGYRFLRSDLLIFGILVAVIIAFLADLFVGTIGRYLSRWQ
jgi:ABC-type nitrate/sulfonate/bicarbonate transport system permease component